LLAWVLIVYGITKIVTGAKVMRWLRSLYPPLFECALCFSFWVGLGVTFLPGHPGPAAALSWPLWLSAIGNAFAASAINWLLRVSLAAIGEDKL
jgi:hypothetical protein